MTADIWRHLGIPQTDSEPDIRRAYAERLKTTHPEDDPEGFKRLRSAYERALQQIRWRARYAAADDEAEAQDWDDDEVEAEAGASPRGSLARADAPAVALEPLPAPDPELLTHEDLRQKLERAVAGQGSPWEIQAAFQALVTNPAMERLPVHAATETWLANLIRRYEGGGPLFDCATAHFKWSGASRRGDLGDSMMAFRETLTEERKAQAFLARVRDRRHEFHDAYKEASRPIEERNLFSRLLSFPRIDLVRRFLDYVEDKIPYAQDELDYMAVDWWRRRINFWLTPLSIAGKVIPIGMVVGVIALFGIFTPDSGEPSRWTRMSGRTACAEAVEQSSADGRACGAYLQEVPDSLLMRQYAGIIALRQNRLNDARTDFAAIANASPLDPAARYGLGMAFNRSADAAEQEQGVAMMREALAIDDTVSIYFAQNGVEAATVLDPAERYEPFPEPRGPRYDVPPGEISLEGGDSVFSGAYDHFGISPDFDGGRVLVQCLLRANGRFTDCQIMEETPRNRGRGEVAIRVMASARATPATLNGDPVDGVPVRVPVTFRLE
ncbi:MAG: TonB family protein [Vitreimonas sp.]